MAIKPVTVSQLSAYLKQIFDAEELLHGISVVGEISGWSNVRGTAYFTLKDEGSALSCVCFTADNFSNFKNGDSVLVVGTPRYYVKGGKLNFNVVKIESYGQSVLYQQYLELKQKLEDLGYFSAEHKKAIPSQIKRIGVVSSEGGAVIQDIINIRTRRNPNIDIVLYPVKVQGVNAEYEIVKGIRALDNYNVDVIVVARGGGSFEDLQPFNTEVVAKATYECNKPIVSAVGHETDYTIIDFVSDLRAPTPSAAAELLCEDLEKNKDMVKRIAKDLTSYVINYMKSKLGEIRNIAYKLNDEYEYVLQDYRNVFNTCLVNINKFITNFLDKYDTLLKHRKEVLTKMNPGEVLKLGYACVRNGVNYISSVKEVKVGDNVNIYLKDGQIKANVMEIE